jgi:predicted kinase
MQHPLLIIITGLPCSGKTTLGYRIATEFQLPILTKDGIKEVLFDTLGWSDREWSKKLSRASNFILLHCARRILTSGQSLILESNFPPQYSSQPFQELRQEIPFTALQILCFARGEELAHRFRMRWETGQRHPGHVDDQSFAEILATLIPGRLAPLDLNCPIIEVDTTIMEQIDYRKLFTEIRNNSGGIL